MVALGRPCSFLRGDWSYLLTPLFPFEAQNTDLLVSGLFCLENCIGSSFLQDVESVDAGRKAGNSLLLRR